MDLRFTHVLEHMASKLQRRWGESSGFGSVGGRTGRREQGVGRITYFG